MNRVITTFVGVLSCFGLLGCPRTGAPAATEDPTPTASTKIDPKPAPSPAPSPAPLPSTSSSTALPTVDLACTADSECVVFDETLSGIYTCCPGCTLNVANGSSLKAFRAACKATPAPACPPLGCLMPASPKAKCDAGKCLLVK